MNEMMTNKIQPCPMSGCGKECVMNERGEPACNTEYGVYCPICEYQAAWYLIEQNALAAHEQVCAWKKFFNYVVGLVGGKPPEGRWIIAQALALQESFTPPPAKEGEG